MSMMVLLYKCYQRGCSSFPLKLSRTRTLTRSASTDRFSLVRSCATRHLQREDRGKFVSIATSVGCTICQCNIKGLQTNSGFMATRS